MNDQVTTSKEDQASDPQLDGTQMKDQVKNLEPMPLTSAQRVFHTPELVRMITGHLCHYGLRNVLLLNRQCFDSVVNDLWRSPEIELPDRDADLSQPENWPCFDFSLSVSKFYEYMGNH
ncbi:hypothetical protein M231_04226 [Tremella mesenterica]|uniref:Uncharacterized protein n=1 Tax=Tremella mesenterica TaxID=5217 RepID=A0A4Q1BL02_TREME|nr:hypothetical protein M231_04226 [Tremella mesenterica]